MKRMITLAAFDKESGHLNAIVDTPKGSRNKFKYDEQLGLFKLGGTLPVGNVFPFDFGYIPSTRGDDDDALDILLLMDEPAFTGCLVPAKLIGVVEAEQTEEQKTRAHALTWGLSRFEFCSRVSKIKLQSQRYRYLLPDEQ